jgi:cytoskeletal protein RodZ
MSTTQPEPTVPSSAGASPKRSNPWIWISAVLAIVAAGLAVWGFSTKSDLDSSKQDVANLQTQLDQSKSTGGTVLATAKAAFGALAQELGATQEDLATATQQVQNAQKTATDAQAAAQQAADKAKASAKSAADKANAAADEAKAQAQAASAKASVAGNCAKAYVSAFGTLFDGSSVRAQAATVRQQLQGITADCKAALGGT